MPKRRSHRGPEPRKELRSLGLVFVYVYVYIYIEREREREKKKERETIERQRERERLFSNRGFAKRQFQWVLLLV